MGDNSLISPLTGYKVKIAPWLYFFSIFFLLFNKITYNEYVIKILHLDYKTVCCYIAEMG